MGVGEKHNNFSLKKKKKSCIYTVAACFEQGEGGSPGQPLAPVESCASFLQLERVRVSENEIQSLIRLGSFIVDIYLCL